MTWPSRENYFVPCRSDVILSEAELKFIPSASFIDKY